MKCKSRQELAKEYGVDRKTLMQMLERRQIKLPRGALTPKWVEKVYEALGNPNNELPPPSVD